MVFSSFKLIMAGENLNIFLNPCLDPTKIFVSDHNPNIEGQLNSVPEAELAGRSRDANCNHQPRIEILKRGS